MERVAFLVEDSGERIHCLLNPNSLEIRRLAGVQRRSSLRGPLVTEGLADDPVLTTGGGSTEVDLQLLFDLAAEGADEKTSDVRQLTGPLWRMSEGQPPLVRFVWGKSWNMPAVVVAASERLEHFGAGGSPRRSWLSLRLLRVEESVERYDAKRRAPRPQQLTRRARSGDAAVVRIRELPGDGSGRAGERLDQVAQEQYGDPAYWRLLASANDLADPLNVPVGTRLRLPRGS